MILRVLNLIVLVSFMLSIPVIVFFQSNINYYSDYISTLFQADETEDVYDFIVVGGGTSGSVVANRLSKNNKVLVLEAGGDPLFPSTIPGLALEMLHRPQMDWMYRTVPQKHSNQGMTDKKSLWPRGKVLGGSSNLNYGFYVRGNKHDYDNWANITGDSAWKYDNLVPFFKRSLNYKGKHVKNEKHYGQSAYGNLQVQTREWSPMVSHFLNATKQIGFSEVDLNGPQKTGVERMEVTQNNGRRVDTFKAFLEPIFYRNNLRVARYSHVIKVKLDKNNRADGVWYVRHGKKKFARASKEVIVSGGSVDSPKLLMLSGIGPKEQLKSVGIKPRVNLPVGKNLLDHLALPISFVIDEPISLIPERDMGLQDFIDYFYWGYGPLTCPSSFYVHAMYCTSVAKCHDKDQDWPDLQIFFGSAGIFSTIDSDFSRGFGFDYKMSTAFYGPFKGSDGIIIAPTLVRPKSIGEIKLKDKNPFSSPVIDPKYLEHPDDVKVLIEGVKTVLKIVEETKALQNINARLMESHFPGCEKFKFRSDEYWECYVRHWAMTLYHPVGTCSMGRDKNDPKAVVNSKLSVLSTKGLRIIDGSVMRNIVNANTYAACVMIGERGAEFIREFWSEQFLVSDLLDRFKDHKSTMNKCYYSKLV